jgi:hypothetical protein
MGSIFALGHLIEVGGILFKAAKEIAAVFIGG